MEYLDPTEGHRHADHPVDSMFLKRWSPRSMNGRPLELSLLMTLLEAARWAPSSGNGQPWRFVYGLGGTPGFQRLFETLNATNQPWCAKAGALILVISQTQRERRGEVVPIRTHSFDTGAAWMSLALQGSLLKIVVHGMAGFDYDAARLAVSLPADFVPEAMIAVGYPAPTEQLPESYRESEKPSNRNSVAAFAFAEKWPG